MRPLFQSTADPANDALFVAADRPFEGGDLVNRSGRP
jgi:hypothetical protein